jgi:hypothetical protein
MSEQLEFYNNLLKYFGKITNYFSFLPIIIMFWKRIYLTKPTKLFLIYLIALILSNMLEQMFIWLANNYTAQLLPYLKQYSISDTNFLNIFNRLPDYIFVGWIFSFAIKDPLGNYLKKISWGLVPLVIFIYFFVDGFTTYGTFNSALSRIYLVVVPVIYFWYLFNSPPHLSLWKNSFFLFGLGLFVPNLVGLFMSFVGDKLYQTDYVSFVKLSLFRNGLTIMAQFLFALAFYYAHFTKFLEKKV